MTGKSRLWNIISGVLTIAVGIVMCVYPAYGLGFAAAILSFTCTLRGFGTLHYYLTMARHMVGGKRMLYFGVMYLDLGLFTSAVAGNARIYLVLYLAVIHAFNGFIDILRSRERKAVGTGDWKWTAANGFTNVIIAIAAITAGLVLRSEKTVVYIYAAGLIYAACLRLAGAFRKYAIVYIQ